MLKPQCSVSFVLFPDATENHTMWGVGFKVDPPGRSLGGGWNVWLNYSSPIGAL